MTEPVPASGQPSLITYPSDFPIKIMGHAQPGFTDAVLSIIQHHAPDFDKRTMEARTSSKAKYLSLTCTIRAVSREQLDAIYQELSGHPMVVMAL
jgi:uncharacterized protein